MRAAHGQAFTLWIDTCLCSYTEHGHCCVFGDDDQIDLPATLEELSGSAVAFARAGADGVSPSDMMDGRTAAIRAALDDAGFGMIPVMSYSTKFASSFYGPFRDAAGSAPQFGDRKAYQIDPRNRTDALRSSVRCAEEGADLLMVKPGMTSIDLIAPIRDLTGLAVGAYQVSGEYAGLALLAEKGLADLDRALLETWYVFQRAGAQYIITYGARRAASMGVSPSSWPPLGIDHAPKSLRDQNGPPGCTSNTSSPAGRRRKSSSPELCCRTAGYRSSLTRRISACARRPAVAMPAPSSLSGTSSRV